MNEQEMRALFLLAGIPVRKAYKLANNYWPDCAEYAEERRNSPWWLVAVEGGNIKLGWRKRVISIEWDDTAVRHIVTKDETTKDEAMVHAWSYAKAVEYLTELQRLLRRAPSPPDKPHGDSTRSTPATPSQNSNNIAPQETPE